MKHFFLSYKAEDFRSEHLRQKMELFLNEINLEEPWKGRLLWLSSELMHNAQIHGSEPEGEILLTLEERQAGEWLLSVSDEGTSTKKEWSEQDILQNLVRHEHLALSHGAKAMAEEIHIEKSGERGHKISLLLKIKSN